MRVRSNLTLWLIFLFSILFASDGGEATISNLTLQLLDGRQVKLYTLLDKGPVLIDFWATWCVPCKKEMIFLERLYQNYKDQGVTVLTINQDTPKSLSKVKSYIRSRRYTFLVALDPNQQIAQQLNAVVLPTALLVDQEYRIVWRHQGYLPGDEVELERQVLLLLKPAPKVTE